LRYNVVLKTHWQSQFADLLQTDTAIHLAVLMYV